MSSIIKTPDANDEGLKKVWRTPVVIVGAMDDAEAAVTNAGDATSSVSYAHASRRHC